MKRRTLLKGGLAAYAGLVAGGTGLLQWSGRSYAANVSLTLTARLGTLNMIDGASVRVLTFSRGLMPEFPGPMIVCRTGDTVTVSLSNPLNMPIAFHVGRTAVRQVVAPYSFVTFTFDAPAPGTYLYYDDQNNGVNRVLGLHGTLVVMPADVKDRSFETGPQFVRQYKWVLASIDPVWGDLIAANGPDYVSNIDPESFMPRYFTINGASFDNTEEPDTEVKSLNNQPVLVRILNAGGMINSPHFHGNHVEIISVNGANFTKNRKKKDIVSMFPLDTRDVLLPMISPPDAWPPTQDVQHFPMHCHAEMSQTAGGGHYPRGMHAAIVIGEAPLVEPDLTRAVA